MRNKIVMALMGGIIPAALFVNSVFAGFGGGHNNPPPRPPCVPEPVSCLLFIASGATYAGIRYLRVRKSRNLDKEIPGVDEGM
ncbi:MAG: hypothetical protein NG747_14250 [Candidatus Brocadia sp.]|nr:hypothetical protein [Candidatus Brocadia sp.]